MLYNMIPKVLLGLALVTVVLSPVRGWSTSEMQMFDLVEDLKMSFYEYIGVPEDASSGDIRRAYRKLSLSMHPDKNLDDPDAQKKFQRLVAVYEVLKDDELRKQYDEVLVHGLPDWRQPIFYLRKVRKMSNIELGLLVVLIATLIHYAVLWGSVIEQRWTMTDKLNSMYKRHKASGKKLETIDAEIAEHLNTISKPGFADILPFAVVRWTIAIGKAIPVLFSMLYSSLKDLLHAKKKERQEAKEIENIRAEKRERKRQQLAEQEARLKEEKQKIAANQAKLKSKQPFNISDLPADTVKTTGGVDTVTKVRLHSNGLSTNAQRSIA